MQFSLCHRKPRTVIILATLLFAQLVFVAAMSRAQNEPAPNENPISAYQRHRQEFIAEQVNADKSYNAQVSALKSKIEKLKEENTKLESQQGNVESTIAGRKQTISSLTSVQNWVTVLLFPMLSIGSALGSFIQDNYLYIALVAFLSLTVINVFLYIRFKETIFFHRYKMPLIITVAVLIVSIASPLLADDQTKRDQVISKLDSAEKILTRSDYERFIAILEAKPLQHITLPELKSGNPLFKVYPEVDVDSPEYWYTLAALYTHELQNGSAIMAIQKIIDGNKLQKTPEHQEIIINSIKFFLREGQTQQVSMAVDSLAKTALSVPTLLEISILLKQNGMQTSSEKTLSYAISSANSVTELIELIQYFNKQQEREKSDEALLKAIPKVRNLEEIIALTETTIVSGKDLLIGKLIETADKVLPDYQEKMQVVDLFMKYNRKEDAVHFITRIIKGNSAKTEKNIQSLLYIIDACMERNFLPQATNATEALIAILTFNKAKDFPMNLENSLRSSIGLPDEKSIMLTQFYGMINEEQGLNDKAEEAYVRSVLNSLSVILESYGYTFPPSLNDFYLLGRIWVKTNREDLIVQLDRVYSSIEKQFIKQQGMQNEAQLSELQKEIDQLQTRSRHLTDDLKHTRHESLRVMMKLWTHILSTLATIVFITGALSGCVIIARRYSRELSMGKTFGFAVKFWETTGWLQILSVLGVLSGLLSVILAQLLLIFQTIQENTHKALHNHFLTAHSPAGELAHEKSQEAIALQVEHEMIYSENLKKEATL